MKYLPRSPFFGLFVVVLSLSSFAYGQRLNRIEGTVVDKSRVPVGEAFVELSNFYGGFLSRTKTSGAGRFSFYGVGTGRFLIKVLPLGKNLLQQEQDIEISNQNSRSETVFVDFVLEPDTRGQPAVLAKPGTIFVQEVPTEAKNLCESGVEKLGTEPSKGIAELERAVAIFPTYFDALYYLGTTHSSLKQYEKAYPYLMKAVDVNPKSAAAFYSLALSFYNLQQYEAGLLAAKAVVTLNSGSAEGHLLHGTLLRLTGDLKSAEASLRKAKSIEKENLPEIYWQLALLLNKTGRNKEAAEELEFYLKKAPDSEKKQVKELIAKLKGTNVPNK